METKLQFNDDAFDKLLDNAQQNQGHQNKEVVV